MRFVLVAMLVAVPAFAQDKPKEKPKALPRIAINDPEKLKEDADFALQGEYEGMNGEAKYGVQVVAQGEGHFVAKFLAGGLPGAGWDGKTELSLPAKRDGSAATFLPRTSSGTIEVGKITVSDTRGLKGTFAKVERKSPTMGAKPPTGAVVLFAGPGDESQWAGGKLVELSDGKFLNAGIKSKQSFDAFTAHIEFRLPWMPNSRGQGRGNSGFYVQDRYEIQVLDSFGLKGENNECGGVYTQFAPKVNMCLPPMAWQTYDITFAPAAFDGDKKTGPAKLTLKHNGVVVHDAVELKGPTGGGQPESAKPGPIQLQNHGDPLVFRNVWAVEAK